MMSRRRVGRASRKRKQKHHNVVSVSLSHQCPFVRLMKFLHRRGFSSSLLQPATFTDTGRGLRTVKAVRPGELLVSLPEACLLTTDTVLNSQLGPYIKSWKPPLSPLLVLCVFLVCERHRGEASDWSPYIDVLPASYTCPAYFPDDVVALLPANVRKRALEQRDAVWEIHSSNQDFFSSLQPLLSQPTEQVLTYKALRWAWCSVNTRSVFMSRPSSRFLSGQDVYALAPFLDLLNHRPDVQVDAAFNGATKCYEIRSVAGTPAYQQAFINYGGHDNQRLLLEYGFVASGNPHSVVYVETDVLCQLLPSERSLQQKINFLQENNFHQNLTVSSDGPSWRLMTALRVMSLPQTQYLQWRAVLRGQPLSEERESWSLQMARSVCRWLLDNTLQALDQICRLLPLCEPSVKEQLHAVRSLRLEEQCILGSCLETLQPVTDGMGWDGMDEAT